MIFLALANENGYNTLLIYYPLGNFQLKKNMSEGNDITIQKQNNRGCRGLFNVERQWNPLKLRIWLLCKN